MSLFSFLKYVKPIWYLNNDPFSKGVLVNYNELSSEEQANIDFCTKYSSKEASLLDAALQAWFKGCIESDQRKQLTTGTRIRHIGDNYLFLRRFFSPIWSWYVFVLRILTFHNPLVEVRGFRKAMRVKRLQIYKSIRAHPELERAPAPSADDSVSVIIPTLNRYIYLADVLKDLERQLHTNFEVIVVDQSDNFQQSFYDQFKLNIKVIRQGQKALWKARNDAIRKSKGDYILLFDDDSRVDPDWILRHLHCLEYFKADLSSGVSLSVIGNKVPETYSYYKWSDQVDTGNVMVRREVFSKVGLFDRQFEAQRMGDAEFGMRCYLAGLKNISNPKAFRIHLKVGEGGLREMGSWDAFRPRKVFGPRPIPSVLYYFRKYFGNEAARFALLRDTPSSIVPYRFKKHRLLALVGSALSLLFVPVILYQVCLSWKEASRKLKQGPMIDYL